MSRFVPTDVTSTYAAVAALNANFEEIKALMEKAVFRDGTSPNAMLANLDLNHNRILNVSEALSDTDAVPYGQMVEEFGNIVRGPAGPDTQEVLDDFLSAAGAGRVGLADGTTLADNALVKPRALSYGKRTGVLTLRQARLVAADIHNQVRGYASVASTVGGAGKTEYFVTRQGMSPTNGTGVTGSYAYCKAKAIENGGGIIIFYPTGHFNIFINDNQQNRYEIGEDNITVIAPGRNATFWHSSLTGSSVIRNQDLIYAYCSFRTLPGPSSGDYVGDGTKAEVGMVSVFPQFINKLAFIGCKFERSSDGALDIASSTFDPTDPEVYVTVQDCLFRNIDEVTLLGQTGAAPDTTSLDTRKLFITFDNCIWDGCGQRLPKVLGLAFAHLSNCYWQMQPFRRDQPAPLSEYGSCHGASVQGGGWLYVQGCLFTVIDDVEGREATKLITNDISGETGIIKVDESYAEYNMTFAENDTGTIPAIPYSLPYEAPPATAGAAREAWIQDRWTNCGAGLDSAPEGLFIWDATSTEYCDQTYVVRRRGPDGTFLDGREIRIDAREEIPLDPGVDEDSEIEARGYTRTVGFKEGKTTRDAIGPTALDLANQDSSFFAIQGNGGTANLKFLQYTDGSVIADGQEVTFVGTASAAVTIKNSTSIAVTVVDTANNSLTIPSHGMTTGDFPISFTNSGGALPTGMVSQKQYYAIVIDANRIQLAETYEGAVPEDETDPTVPVDLTTSGTGTHTALIGSFNLPGGRDIVLDSSAKITKFRMHSGATNRLVPQGYFPTTQAAISDPSGGTTVDTQSRTAIVAIIDALQANGIVL